MRQVEFVTTYPKADIELDQFMHLSHGVQIADGSRRTNALKLLKNVNEYKQAGRVLHNNLKTRLLDIRFTRSDIGEYSFYHGKTSFHCYADDGMFALSGQGEIDQAITHQRNVNFGIEDKGDLGDYLDRTIENCLMEELE
eukprot:13350475-Ditylum_brightwellii.AAC.1